MNKISKTIDFVYLEQSSTPAIYVELFQRWTEDFRSNIERPHRHHFHEIMYFQSGTGTHLIDGVTYKIKPQTLSLITKGRVHVFQQAKQLSGFLISFTDDLLLSNSDNHLFTFPARKHESIALAPADQNYIKSLLNLINQEYKKENASTDILRYFIHALLANIWQLSHVHNDSYIQSANLKEIHLYQKFQQLLELNFKTHHKVSFYAKELDVSVSYLLRLILQVSGKSPKQMIVERIVLEAKRYLQFTDWAVQRIGSFLGYKDALYFSRAFKQVVKFSPQEFRKHSRKSA